MRNMVFGRIVTMQITLKMEVFQKIYTFSRTVVRILRQGFKHCFVLKLFVIRDMFFIAILCVILSMRLQLIMISVNKFNTFNFFLHDL